MNRLLSFAATLAVALALSAGLHVSLAPSAAAQYTPAEGFNLSWSLDPRDYPEILPRSGFGARSVLVGMDFDRDGLKEILFTTDETLAPLGPDPGVLDVVLFEATGNDTYEYVWHYSHPDSSNSLPALAWGDMDKDGLYEIYFGIPTLDRMGNPNDLFIFEQNAEGVFPDTPTAAYAYERDSADDFRPAGFAIGDFDGDEIDELATVSRTSGNRELVVISADGDINEFASFTIEFEAGEDLLGGGAIYDVDSADFDGDGNMELWVSTWDNLSMTVFEATGPDTYELQVDINDANDVNDPGSFNSHKLLFVDVDGDGALELYLPMTDGILYIVESLDDVANLAPESFVPIGTFDPGGNARGSDLGDLDGDEFLDIVANHGTGEKVSWIEYDGVGSPTDSTSYSWSILLDSSGDELSDRYYPMRIADDLDGDGLNEVVITNLFASDPGQLMILVVEAPGAPVPNERDIATPKDFRLRQNYPNPFNPTTTIGYSLHASGPVSLRVYTVMGQLVRTLVDGVSQPAGAHEANWDGRTDAGHAVVSGTYLYVLEADGFRETRRMTLLK